MARMTPAASVFRSSAAHALVIRSGSGWSSGRTVRRTARLDATSKVRVPPARRIRYTVEVAAFTTHGVRDRASTARGAARR
jgi:hypothetical protein